MILLFQKSEKTLCMSSFILGVIKIYKHPMFEIH